MIPFNLSDDGKTLRIRDQKYVKISEDIAKTAVKNRKDCNDLKVKYTEEKKPFDGFSLMATRTKPNLMQLKQNIKNYSKKYLNAILVFKSLKNEGWLISQTSSITFLGSFISLTC